MSHRGLFDTDHRSSSLLLSRSVHFDFHFVRFLGLCFRRRPLVGASSISSSFATAPYYCACSSEVMVTSIEHPSFVSHRRLLTQTNVLSLDFPSISPTPFVSHCGIFNTNQRYLPPPPISPPSLVSLHGTSVTNQRSLSLQMPTHAYTLALGQTQPACQGTTYRAGGQENCFHPKKPGLSVVYVVSGL